VSGESWFPEPFGPIYERPPGEPCPECECCTLRLCLIAASKDTLCSHRSDDPQTVAGCPCSVTAVARARTRTMLEGDDEPDERGVSEYNREEFALDRGDEPW